LPLTERFANTCWHRKGVPLTINLAIRKINKDFILPLSEELLTEYVEIFTRVLQSCAIVVKIKDGDHL
jgi:hypothetical protein